MYLYHAKNLIKKYKNGEEELYALNDVDVYFEQNKINTILGPSGSGKTTSLNMLSGLDRIDSGEILFEGEDISKLKEKGLTKYRRDNIGFIFQSYNLISTLTARENVELGAYLSKDALNVDEVLEEVGLTDHKDKYPHQLSGGMQQRVTIAMAIINNPKILIADEPTTALDITTSVQILYLLKEIMKNYGISILFITHDISLAAMFIILKLVLIISAGNDTKLPNGSFLIALITSGTLL